MNRMYNVGQLAAAERELGMVGKPPNQKTQVKVDADYSEGIYRVQPLPFDGQTLTANGAFVLTATADRPCKPVKIIVYHSNTTGAEVCNIDGITIQGINQLLGAGLIPVSAFAEDSPSEDLPWDWSPLNSNGSFVMNGNLLGFTTGSTYVWAVAKVIAAQS